MTVREWINLWNGRGIDEDGAYGNQCWDLAAKYAKEMIGCPRLPTRPGGNGGAKDVFEMFMAPLGQYFDRISNDPNNPNQVPQPGDLIVWGAPMGTLVENGVATAYGHIAVVVSASPGVSTVKVFEQVASVGNATLATRNYRYVIGWLSPKTRPAFETAAPAPAPAPAAPVPNLPDGEFYQIRKGDTFWQLEEWWDLPHGTLQSLNPSASPRSLAIGQHIRVRSAAVTPAPVNNEEFYTIQQHDTFWDLETEWGYEHGTLQNLNPTLNPRTLGIGQQIRRKAPVPAPVNVAVAPAPDRVAPALVSEMDPAQIDAVIAEIDKEETTTTPEPTQQVFVPRQKPEVAKKPGMFHGFFARDKVLKDLSALGTWISAGLLFVVDHYTLIAWVLTALGGVIFGENRFKLKK